MLWLLSTIVGYFLNAVSVVNDKVLLRKNISQPVVYTFYIGVLGLILVLILVPFFGIAWPDFLVGLVSLVSGAVFIWALMLMFNALKKDDASRVSPMIGGLVPIFVFVLAWYVLEEKLTATQCLAFVFLIIGTFLISLDFRNKGGALQWLKKKFGLNKNSTLPRVRDTLWLALPAAVLFGVYHVLTKFVYLNTDFVNGFMWIRLGSLIAIVCVSVFPHNRQLILNDLKKNSKKGNQQQTKRTGIQFLIGQACGGVSLVLLQYAVFLSSVTLVNALQGMQYVFVFLFVLILTLFLPKVLKEEISKEIFIQKSIAVVLIFIGLWLVVV